MFRCFKSGEKKNMRFCGFAAFFRFLEGFVSGLAISKGFGSSLGKCCGVLHRSSEVWCAKDEQTDTIYAVKNICEATCPTKCREWNDTKCMEWLWNQLSVSSAMCKTFGFSPRFAAWNWGPQHLGSEPQGVWGQRSHPLDATSMSLALQRIGVQC